MKVTVSKLQCYETHKQYVLAEIKICDGCLDRVGCVRCCEWNAHKVCMGVNFWGLEWYNCRCKEHTCTCLELK